MKKAALLISLILVGTLMLCGCKGKAEQVETLPTTTTSPTTTNLPATATATLIPSQTPIPTLTPTPYPEISNRVYGINLGPYLHDNPNYGAVISEKDLRRLIENIAPYTDWIRTFGCENGLENAGAIAHKFGLQVAAGAWLSEDVTANEKQMTALINMAKNGEVDLAIIGNEVLHNNTLTVQELIAYINQFREAVPNVPVTTADVWEEISQYPELIAAVDMVAVNKYPYWDGVAIEASIAAFEEWYFEAKNLLDILSPGKELIITETGWSSCGNAGSPANQASYFGSFLALAEKLNIPTFWFEAYDEQWKSEYEGEAGACWGLWDSEEMLKEGLDEVFSGEFVDQIQEAGEPHLEITNLPPIGSYDILEGTTLNIDPDEYNIVVYIYVPDASGWWVKPAFDYPYTPINPNGEWSCMIVTGGIDEQATKIAVFLVPVGYFPPGADGWSSLPQELYDVSVDFVEVNRN